MSVAQVVVTNAVVVLRGFDIMLARFGLDQSRVLVCFEWVCGVAWMCTLCTDACAERLVSVARMMLYGALAPRLCRHITAYCFDLMRSLLGCANGRQPLPLCFVTLTGGANPCPTTLVKCPKAWLVLGAGIGKGRHDGIKVAKMVHAARTRLKYGSVVKCLQHLRWVWPCVWLCGVVLRCFAALDEGVWRFVFYMRCPCIASM
ncbi:MAG: hypothetical protein EAY75_16560 [Bacteroidetes bacterium]|nr:MAG: hypothetical protein EAY75_16560 [Bacteroidota bacterium]